MKLLLDEQLPRAIARLQETSESMFVRVDANPVGTGDT